MVVAAALLCGPAIAEIEKTALICQSSVCFYWWPKLSQPKGWHGDRDSSYQLRANVLVPDGSTFSNAGTVIYAEALYKPDHPETTSLEALIAGDKEQFLEHRPDTRVASSGALVTGDGKKLESFTFFPGKEGDWEKVSYGEEGDFYLIFTVSSRTEKAYKEAEPVYKSVIGNYRESP